VITSVLILVAVLGKLVGCGLGAAIFRFNFFEMGRYKGVPSCGDGSLSRTVGLKQKLLTKVMRSYELSGGKPDFIKEYI
jgi:hypothetical protein